MDELEIDFPCGECEQDFQVKIEDLKPGTSIICPHCKSPNPLIGEDGDETLKKYNEAIDKIFKPLKGRRK